MFVISSHSGEGRNPLFTMFSWMPTPAYIMPGHALKDAGMTKKTINQRLLRFLSG
jgi:hypothetical protein